MKASQNRLREEHRLRAEAIVETHVAALFRRQPALCGFSMGEDLELDDVAVHTWPGFTAGEDLYRELVQTLADLVEERPDAFELLRGRTFARALH